MTQEKYLNVNITFALLIHTLAGQRSGVEKVPEFLNQVTAQRTFLVASHFHTHSMQRIRKHE